jgi:hypothetical protein
VANNQAEERGAHSGTNGEEGYIIQRKKKMGPKGASTFSKFFFWVVSCPLAFCLLPCGFLFASKVGNLDSVLIGNKVSQETEL